MSKLILIFWKNWLVLRYHIIVKPFNVLPLSETQGPIRFGDLKIKRFEKKKCYYNNIEFAIWDFSMIKKLFCYEFELIFYS